MKLKKNHKQKFQSEGWLSILILIFNETIQLHIHTFGYNHSISHPEVPHREPKQWISLMRTDSCFIKGSE